MTSFHHAPKCVLRMSCQNSGQIAPGRIYTTRVEGQELRLQSVIVVHDRNPRFRNDHNIASVAEITGSPVFA
jgi:hypothetical protein